MAEITISDVMKEYAQDAKRLASEQGISLDDTEESLERVDLLLHKIAGNTVLTPRTPEEASQLWALAKIYGGYVGEVVIRNMGGAWELQDNPDGSARVVLHCEGVRMFPPDKVYKRLTEDQFSNVSGYCRALRAIIKLQRQ
jgi:hypothetical protein